MKKLALIPLKTRIKTIRSAYEKAADSIVAILSSLDPETFNATKAGTALSRVMNVVGRLDAAVKRWVPGSIRAAYNEGAAVARTRLEAIGLEERRYNAKRHERKIGKLIKTVMTDYWDANRTIETTARKYIALMTVASREVKKVEAFAGDEDFPYIKRIVQLAKGVGVTESQTRTSVSRKILEHLRRKIGGGDFIEINGRHFNLRDYSELVARTRMRESQTEAVKEMGREFDADLMQITVHDDPCPICAERQGEVYSISGDTPGYELLPDGGPPWHPNCECTGNLTSEIALRQRNA